MLRLRPFKNCDMEYLIQWVNQDEKLFVRWCAYKFSYPLTKNQLIAYKDQYEMDEHGWIFTALNEAGSPIGHLLMRKADYEN